MTEPVPPEDDGSALVPAVLAAYAAYRAYRGAHDSIPSGDWVQTATVLGLKAIIGAQLVRLAYRALNRQRDAAGRPGDELLAHVQQATDAGVEAGFRALAQAIVWTDVHSTGDLTPKDIAGPGDRAPVPTLGNPPELLAEMVAGATVDAAQFQAAQSAGWQKVTWRTRQDDHVRQAHQDLEGKSVTLGASFLPDVKLRFPHDPRAPIALTANCRCRLAASRR